MANLAIALDLAEHALARASINNAAVERNHGDQPPDAWLIHSRVTRHLADKAWRAAAVEYEAQLRDRHHQRFNRRSGCWEFDVEGHYERVTKRSAEPCDGDALDRMWKLLLAARAHHRTIHNDPHSILYSERERIDAADALDMAGADFDAINERYWQEHHAPYLYPPASEAIIDGETFPVVRTRTKQRKGRKP
jgi:hypothetical protein